MRDDTDDADWAVAIEALNRAVAALPRCQQAAKLAVFVSRLERAVADGVDPEVAVMALATASRRALDDDPWAQIDVIAQRLLRGLTASSTRRRGEVTWLK